MRLAILGGDQRQIFMARKLAEDGHKVFIWGLGECGSEIVTGIVCARWEEAIREAEAVILPLPASADGVRVYCPLQREDVFLRVPALLDALGDRVLLGGRFTESLRGIAEQKGVHWIDYYESEVLQLKNALPTAEGAIAIAMRELPVTIDGIHAVILGYGRIGSVLGQKLHGLGAHVTVYARRSEQLALATLNHHTARKMSCSGDHTGLSDLPQDCRVIFNTVPHWLLTRNLLSKLPKSCVLIDLASAPGGIDHNTAAELGLRSVWGTSLPGKCTPESAGYILAEVLEEILSDMDIQL